MPTVGSYELYGGTLYGWAGGGAHSGCDWTCPLLLASTIVGAEVIEIYLRRVCCHIVLMKVLTA